MVSLYYHTIKKGNKAMVQITVTVNHDGKSYLTNVITHRGTQEEEIVRLAQEQVQRQWQAAN
jgi:hypothetical protein